MITLPSLTNRQTANCPRCGSFLTRFSHDDLAQVLAYSVAGIILFLLANSYEFLSFSSSGLESVITLRQTPGALWDYGMPIVGMIVALFIIVIPLFVLLLLVSISVPLLRGQYRFWLKPAAKGVFLTHNWAMVEVFIIGVIVSLVKISTMATVVLGISFWAYAAFSICFALALSQLDRFQCWERIEHLATS